MYEIKYSAYLDEESFPSLHLPAGAGKCSPGRPGEVDIIDFETVWLTRLPISHRVEHIGWRIDTSRVTAKNIEVTEDQCEVDD